MKIPPAMLERLAVLEGELREAAEKVRGANDQYQQWLLKRDELQAAIAMVKDAPDQDTVAADPEADAPTRERRTKAKMRMAIQDAIKAAGAEGATVEQLAKAVRLRIPRVDEMVKDLLQARECAVEGDRVMSVDNAFSPVFDAAT